MGENRSAGGCFYLNLLFVFTFVLAVRVSLGYTTPNDVAAINSLYAALGFPSLPGWVATGGDPCIENWQGVVCDVTRTFIISIKLIGANLGGELGDNLGSFSSIIDITLSNNLIGGSIPTNMPSTLVNIFLSDNKLTGSIPSSLSYMSNLSALSLNNNELTGGIPDAFEGLTQLVNVDFSSNNLSGQLPGSMRNLSTLTTLHLQNNQLSGTLDVLEDLPLKNLDVRNNQFSEPIPAKLLNIPSFWIDGNPINTSIVPSPPTSWGSPPPLLPFFPGPASDRTPPTSGRIPRKPADGPSALEGSNSKDSKKSSKKARIILISIASVISFIILLLVILLLMPRCLRKKRETYRSPERLEVIPYNGTRETPLDGILPPPLKEEEISMRSSFKPGNDDQMNKRLAGEGPRKNYDDIDSSIMPPPPPPPPPVPQQKVVVNPIAAVEVAIEKPLPGGFFNSTSVKAYTIASLQQFTNSFSPENLVGGGMLGNVYRADLPDGRSLAVKKLDKRVVSQQNDEQFIVLVNSLVKIRHVNVVELMGYSAEYGQRLLIYEYCSSGTLQDALLSDEQSKKKPTWNTRIRMALGAARALEYLHEVCEPPVIHRNFKSANVLLDEEISIRVSDCGLSPLISSGAVNQLSGQLLTTYGYGAPEFESGVYTSKSDVYSFGVVMLELLTGRMSYDRTRTREEQFLVRWTIPQLHDIDALSRMVDPSLKGMYPVKSLSRFADIISRCVLAEPEFRPLMSEVVHDLVQLIRKESPSGSSDRD